MTLRHRGCAAPGRGVERCPECGWAWDPERGRWLTRSEAYDLEASGQLGVKFKERTCAECAQKEDVK